MKSILIMLSLMTGVSYAADVNQIVEINDAAQSWVSKDGQPLYYTSGSSQYVVENQSVRRMTAYSPDATITLSPNGDYRLILLLQDLGEIKNGDRYSDYFILDENNDLIYTVYRGVLIFGVASSAFDAKIARKRVFVGFS